MTRWHEWFQDEKGLVAFWSPAGVLSREGEVPAGARALRLDDGEQLLPAGEVVKGKHLLVREHDLPVTVRVTGLRDRDDLPGTLVIDLVVDPPESRVSALLLRDHTLEAGGRDRYGAAELAEELIPVVRDVAMRLLQHGTWEDDAGVVPRLRGGDLLSQRLHPRLFELGLSLMRVSGVHVESPELDERRRRRLELEQEADRIQKRLEFIELWRREETGEALARAEVEKLESHLRKEGLLRKLVDERELTEQRIEAERTEARARGQMRRMLERERLARDMEIDSERLEAEIAQAKNLEKALEDSGLVGMVHGVEDPLSKERLLKLLIQKEMTPEQIAAGAARRDVRRLEEQFEDRLAALAGELRSEIRGDRLPEWHRELAPIRRVWIAAGLALYRVDGDDAFAGRSPTPVLPPDDLGYLRSVRVIGQGDEVRVLVGAQGGVLVYRPRGSRWTVHPFRPQPRGRGGVNSVAVVGDAVFGSHSEMGLHYWGPHNGHNASRELFSSRITGDHSTRGVQVGPHGDLYFAHGNEIFRFAVAHLDGGELISCGVLPDSVTALEAAGDTLVAGTRGGCLYRWEEPDRWRLLPFSSHGPIFRIVPAGGAAPWGWLIGAREPAVHVLDRDGALLREYRSRNPIRWVSAGQQGIVAVDRYGQHLLLWSWLETRQPRWRLRVPDQIQYLDVEGGTSS